MVMPQKVILVTKERSRLIDGGGSGRYKGDEYGARVDSSSRIDRSQYVS